MHTGLIKSTLKVFNIILAVLFAVFAVLQINDAEPMLWIVLYGGVAAICAFAAFGRYNLWAILLALAVCAFELIALFPSVSSWIRDGMPSITGSMEAASYVEPVREFFGVVIATAVLVFQYVHYRKMEMHAPK